MSSVAATFKLLSFIIFLSCFKSNSTSIEYIKLTFSTMCNFGSIQANNTRLKVKFVFCDLSEARCQVSQVHLTFSPS